MNTETVDQPNPITEELTLVQTNREDQLDQPSQAQLEQKAVTPIQDEVSKPVNAVTSNLYTPLSKLHKEDPKMNQPVLKTIPIDTTDLEESKSEEMIALEQLICKIDPTEDRIATSISRASTNEGNTKTPDGMKIDGTFIGNIDIINAEGYENKHGTVFVNETGKVIGNITGIRPAFKLSDCWQTLFSLSHRQLHLIRTKKTEIHQWVRTWELAPEILEQFWIQHATRSIRPCSVLSPLPFEVARCRFFGRPAHKLN